MYLGEFLTYLFPTGKIFFKKLPLILITLSNFVNPLKAFTGSSSQFYSYLLSSLFTNFISDGFVLFLFLLAYFLAFVSIA